MHQNVLVWCILGLFINIALFWILFKTKKIAEQSFEWAKSVASAILSMDCNKIKQIDAKS